jgi:hypothetical protein
MYLLSISIILINYIVLYIIKLKKTVDNHNQSLELEVQFGTLFYHLGTSKRAKLQKRF